MDRRPLLTLLGALLVLVGCAGGDGTTAGAPGWERIEPGGRTSCARGGRYAFWLRRADPRKLLIMFEGGGGCFSYETCAPGSIWFDDTVSEVDDPTTGGGLLDLERTDNPFRDYSILFIPVCTGDVHVGDNVRTYTEGMNSVTIRHRGLANARAALSTAFRRFPDASRVFVTGCSAGSAGAALHMPAIIGRYPRARVSYFGDSLAFVFGSPIDLEGDWRAGGILPSWLRIDPRRFTMTGYLTAVARHYPRRTFARFNHASDDVQERYYAIVGRPTVSFEHSLRRAEETLKRSATNYRSFLSCGSDHCVTYDERFYTPRQSGVRLRDWVARLEAGRNVGCPTCRG